MSHIKLDTWKPNFSRDKPFSMIISASRNSGKSNMLKHLYLHYWAPLKMFNVVAVFSETICNDYYSEFLSTKLLYGSLRTDVMNSIIEKAKTYKSRGKDFKVLFIIDDCVSQRDRFNQTITDIYTKGRHFGISIVYITQKMSFCSTSWYNNASHLIFLRNTSRKEMEYIVERSISNSLHSSFDFNTNVTKINRFCMKLLNKLTKNYGAIVCTPLEKESPEEGKEYKNILHVYRAPLMN